MHHWAGRNGRPATRSENTRGSATANHHAKQIDNDKQHLFELNDDKILTSFQSTVTVWNAWRWLTIYNYCAWVNRMANISNHLLDGDNNMHNSWLSPQPDWNPVNPMLEPLEMNLISIPAYNVCLGRGMDDRQGGHRTNIFQPPHHHEKNGG